MPVVRHHLRCLDCPTLVPASLELSCERCGGLYEIDYPRLAEGGIRLPLTALPLGPGRDADDQFRLAGRATSAAGVEAGVSLADGVVQGSRRLHADLRRLERRRDGVRGGLVGQRGRGARRLCRGRPDVGRDLRPRRRAGDQTSADRRCRRHCSYGRRRPGGGRAGRRAICAGTGHSLSLA